MTFQEATENRDFTLIIDRSSSMSRTDRNGKTRWENVREATEGLARVLHGVDKDGLTVYTFAGNFRRYENVSPDGVSRIFEENEPNGSTNLAGVLDDAFNSLRKRKAAGVHKFETIFVITDGEPDNEKAVVESIKEMTHHISDRKEIGLSILQAGNDPGPRAFLKRLDDNLQKEGAKHDIVDTHTFDELENISYKDAIIGSLTD